MATHDRHKRRIEFEALERRETPSAMMGGAHAIHEAARPHIVALRGSGTGNVISLTPLGNGAFRIVTNVNSNTTLGPLSGQITGTILSSGRVGSGSGQFTAQDGAVVNFSLSGSFKKPKNGSSVVSGSFPLMITGGTKEFAGATGNGRVSGTLNEAAGTFTFTINARVRE
jgi:hypothetical protein